MRFGLTQDKNKKLEGRKVVWRKKAFAFPNPTPTIILIIISLRKLIRARLVHVFKNWKLLFENFYGNTCGWKSVLKYVKCCLKTENCCLKTLTKHPLILSFFLLTSANVFSMAHGNLTPHSNTYILLNLASYKIEIILCSPWPMGMHLQPYTAAQHNIYIYIYIYLE